MRNLKTKNYFGYLFAIGYIVASSFIGVVGHNHAIDGNSHDNCLTCQWVMQTKSDDTTTKAIFEAIANHLVFTDFLFCNNTYIFKQEILSSFNRERAPPYIIL